MLRVTVADSVSSWVSVRVLCRRTIVCKRDIAMGSTFSKEHQVRPPASSVLQLCWEKLCEQRATTITESSVRGKETSTLSPFREIRRWRATAGAADVAMAACRERAVRFCGRHPAPCDTNYTVIARVAGTSPGERAVR